MKILMTGATGFIGNHLLEKLLEENHNVTCLVRNRNKGDLLVEKYKVNYIVGDIVKVETLCRLEKNYEVIYHLAAFGHVSAASDQAYQKFILTNEEGTKNLIEYFKDSKTLKRFIHFSSTAAMGYVKKSFLDEKAPTNPLTPYQISKNRSEILSLKAHEDFQFPSIIIRPCMVYGVGGYGEFYKFCKLMKKGFFPKVGFGKNLTPLVNVNDVVQAAVNALDSGRIGEIYIIASDTSISMDDLHAIVMKNIAEKGKYFFVPKWVALLGAKFLEVMFLIIGKEPIVTYRNMVSTITDRTFIIEKAKKDLNYIPQISFERGIEEVIQWYKKEGKI